MPGIPLLIHSASSRAALFPTPRKLCRSCWFVAEGCLWRFWRFSSSLPSTPCWRSGGPAYFLFQGASFGTLRMRWDLPLVHVCVIFGRCLLNRGPRSEREERNNKSICKRVWQDLNRQSKKGSYDNNNTNDICNIQ